MIYLFNERRGEKNSRITSTSNIPWERQSITKIIGAIEYIKPLAQEKNISLADAAKWWKAQNLSEEKKITDVVLEEVLEEFLKIKASCKIKKPSKHCVWVTHKLWT